MIRQSAKHWLREDDIVFKQISLSSLSKDRVFIEAFQRLSKADWIVAGTALFIICNGILVCIGWWARIPTLFQLTGDAPTHFNTALLFIFLGVGELGRLLRRQGVVMAMAVAVICLASAELVEYALRLNLGIDTLFAVPFVEFDALHPGRMSGNTIACFLLVGTAQLLMSKPELEADALTTATVILKSLAGGIAFIALLGYVVGLKSAHGWTDSVGMSIRSCAGFLLIFIASIAALWQRDISGKPGLPKWFLPFLTIAAVSITIGLIWIRSSPIARPFILDPRYAGFAHQASIAIALSIGTLIYLGAVSVLVAKRKAVTARAAEKKLSSVLEHMSEGVMLIDPKGNAFYQNPASLRIHGLEPGGTGFIKNQDLPVSWKGWDEQGRELDLDKWPLSRVTRGERVRDQVLRARRCETDHEFVANYNGSPVYDDHGEIALGFITIQDITERRLAEKAVRESEERFRTLANAIPQLACMGRADGSIVWYNQRWYDYTGTTPEQMEGWGWQSVHDPAVLPTVLSRWREAIALVQPFEMEFPLRGADGMFRNFLTRVQPIYDSEGRVVQWFGTNTDVDQLKRAEQSLRVTQSRLESTLEASSVGTWTWDIASDRLVADDFTARMFSLAPDAAAVGLPAAAYLQVVHEEDRQRVAEALQRAILECSAYDIEYRVRQADGAFRWVQARGRVESDGAGHATYFHGAVIDITAAVTERRRAEHKVANQLERLHLLNIITRSIGERQDLSSISQVVITTLEDQLPIDFGCLCLYQPSDGLTVVGLGTKSRQLAADMGLSEQARVPIDTNGLSRCVSGKLVYEPDLREVQFAFPQRLSAVGLHAMVAAPLMVESKVFGALIVARRTPESFSSGDCEFLGQLSGHVAIAAHQTQLYGALEVAYEDLRQTQQAVMRQEKLRVLGQMASGIAHDINNALSPASLYVESLIERVSGEAETKEYLKIIQRAIDGVAQTVARMKDFYSERDPQLAHVPVSLNQAVEQVTELTRARWTAMPQESGHVIQVKSDLDSALPSIAGNASEIRDAITNLILNAADAMSEGGLLTIRTRAVGPDSVQLEVTDTGVGMDEATRSRCLELFFSTKGARGTGLGLAMVYGTVERHGGEIEIESTPGAGTTVRLIFPVASASCDSTGTIPALIRPPHSLRILVVDDDPIILKSLLDMFERDGHVVETADGGQRGIDAFRAAEARSEAFAVVVTDLGMPYVDGRTVAEAVKADCPLTPVILLTGWGHRILAENDTPANVDRVLSKPPKLAILRAALAELTNAIPARAIQLPAEDCEVKLIRRPGS
jgi:PAS domain S-box-containing protein